MNRSPVIRYAAVLFGLLSVPPAAWAAAPKYFADDSQRGVLSYNNPPSQAMFFSGKHNRTYVTYLDNNFNASVACYDHDTGQWMGPVAADDCRYADGHNTPEILVTRDGYLHLFYGCHGDPVKYARSLYPEDITRWRLGKEFGASNTYPHPVQVGNGDILVFCRRGLPAPGTDHAVTFVYRSTDNGSTWDEGTQLVSFRSHPDEEYRTRAYQRAFVYDEVEDLIYCALLDAGSVGTTWANAKRTHYSVKYDPASRRLIAMNGVDLGTSTNRAELDANECKRRQFFLQVGPRVVTLEPTKDAREEVKKQVWLHNGKMHTADGVNIVGFGSRDRDLLVWTSRDAGKSWDEGRVIVPEAALDSDYAASASVVRDYSGSGPLVIFQGYGEQASPEFVYRYNIRQKYDIVPILLPHRKKPWHSGWNHYSIPARKSKRLYALDRQYQCVTERTSEAGH